MGVPNRLALFVGSFLLLAGGAVANDQVTFNNAQLAQIEAMSWFQAGDIAATYAAEAKADAEMAQLPVGRYSDLEALMGAMRAQQSDPQTPYGLSLTPDQPPPDHEDPTRPFLGAAASQPGFGYQLCAV